MLIGCLDGLVHLWKIGEGIKVCEYVLLREREREEGREEGREGERGREREGRRRE